MGVCPMQLVAPGSTLGLMRCSCHLEIFFKGAVFLFSLGPTDYIAGTAGKKLPVKLGISEKVRKVWIRKNYKYLSGLES